jgi:transcriptional regulator with XRE-family HTH domain
MITAAQLRAARAMLQWSLAELAERADVSVNSITRFETGLASPRRATVAAIQRALEEGGVAFTNGDEPGVKLKRRP